MVIQPQHPQNHWTPARLFPSSPPDLGIAQSQQAVALWLQLQVETNLTTVYNLRQ